MYRSFDALDIAKSFITSVMQAELAETVAKAISISHDTNLRNLATKADLLESENKLENKIAAVDSRLTIEIEKSKNEILKWVVGMNIATISILMAFFKLFIH
jgi:hypothetical protein